ncbi:hypothetical protein ACFYU8_29825 [Brevibacillus sp. NPDC003359]|uniref:hypothetical protein n=1 Tax=unclassified Brevibacillus TaxID=2684853 RepID=UPI0036837B4C
MAEFHRYECHLQTGDRLITLTVYAKNKLTDEEVKDQAMDEAKTALKDYATADLSKDLVFISFKYLGDYAEF